MSALGDKLTEYNKDAVLGTKLTITVDSVVADTEPTYSIRLDGPSFSEVLLTAQTSAEMANAVSEFNVWAVATWG